MARPRELVLGVWIDAGRVEAEAVARRIADEVGQSLAEDGSPPIELAFGVASAPDDGSDFAALLDVAEHELARARHGVEAPGRTLRAA